MRMVSYLGSSFGIWSDRHTWFWFVADSRCNGAAIGAAANEGEADCEARSLIEEMTARQSCTAEPSRIGKTAVRRTRKCPRARSMDVGWNDLLANLERYLAQCGVKV